jgi:hypothetical protein
MIPVEYKDQTLQFPDDMTQEDMAAAIRKLPEEKALTPPGKALPPADRYKTGIALRRINPTVAKEVRRIALEKQYGYIATDPPSFKNFVRNIDIPEYIEELVSGFSSLIAGTGLFTYRFGRNIMQDGNEAIIQKGHPILPGMGPRVQEQVKPVTDLVQAIYYDWKAMFAGEVSDEISKLPLGEYRDTIFDKVDRQGLGDTLKYFVQDNPLDALLVGYILKNMATAGTRMSLSKAQKIVPKGTGMAKALDRVLSTKRTPIIYNLGPEKNFARLSAKVQKDTLKMLKPASDIGGKTLEEVAVLAASDPMKAVRHVRRAKIPFDVVAEGLRNKGAKVVMAASKDTRKTVATNLQLAIDRIGKFGTRKMRTKTMVAQQVNIARKVGGSSFNPAKGNLIGSDNYVVSIFPDYSTVVNGKITQKQLSSFYLKNENLLWEYPELTVGTWYEAGKTHIDLAVTIPTANQYSAIGLARRYNQRAIFNLKTLEETRTGGTGLGIGNLPDIKQRMKDIRRISPSTLEPKTGTAELQHWSTREGLKEIDPAKHGTGIGGAEAERKIADPANWIDKSYYGIKGGGYAPETELAIKYEVDIPYRNLYDFVNDPLKLKTKAVKGDPISLYEKAIHERGYKGYYVNSPTKGNTVALFDKATVKTKPGPGEKIVTFERKYSEDLLTKYIFEKTFDAALEKFPAMKAALAEHKAKHLVNTMRNLSDEANFKERASMHQEIFKELNKLTKEEQKIIVPYLEGRAQLVREPSQQFKNFELWYRKLIDKHEDYLWKAGRLPESRNILYQPLAKATGQTVEQVKTDLGSFTPVYVHHTFPRMFDAKMNIHFAETTGKRFKPGFMKQRHGVEGYSENLKEILPKYTSEYIKLKNTEQFIDNFTKKFGIRVNLKNLKEAKGILYIGDKAYPGHKILAPDGYLSYYRGKVDFQKEIIKQMENTTFDEAVGNVIAQLRFSTKEYLGVSKNKVVYLVPKEMLGELESFATPVFGSQKVQDVIRLVVDKPTQVWKDSVLAASPRWAKNNVMGDIIFNTFEGVGPLSYSRAFRTVYKDCIPDELLRASFANVMKYNPKLGKTANTAIGRYVQAFLDTKVVAGVAFAKDLLYALNTMLEQPFVRALYIHLARPKAITMLKQQKVARTEANILAKMRVIKNDPVLVGPLVNKVHETLPVFNLLGNFERKYIRRFVPFANWYKFMLKYGATLPSKHPFKLIGARGLGALTEEHREGVYKDYFPFMAREIENGGIPSRFDHMWPIGQRGEKMAKFFNVRGMNPFTTIEDFVNLDLVNMASPIITVPVEQMTGRAIFGNRKFESGEAGITVTHKGLEYKEFAKVRPPLVDHILSQLPQYTLLKKWLVPAKQWDSGSILNPDPILNPDTGEYVYPIESMEKILNMLGIDQKTLDIQKVWYLYQNRKAQALGRALTKHREHLSFDDIRGILNEIQADKELWEQLRNEMDEKAYYEEEKTREFLEKVK